MAKGEDKALSKMDCRGWRDGSVVRNTHSSSRRLECGPQHVPWVANNHLQLQLQRELTCPAFEGPTVYSCALTSLYTHIIKNKMNIF